MSRGPATGTPFVIVADLRTGSTLVGASLDRHPDVRCYGEIFHHTTFPDNGLENADRFRLSGREVIRRALHEGSERARGFRAMIFLPDASRHRWSDAWRALGDERRLKVLSLSRRDPLAQYASLRVAQTTGVYHPWSGDPLLEPKNRPSVEIEPEELAQWVEERKRLWDRSREWLQGKPTLELVYEELTADWRGEMGRVLEFLGVRVLPLPQVKSKQERRPLSEVIRNYGELRSRFAPPS